MAATDSPDNFDPVNVAVRENIRGSAPVGHANTADPDIRNRNIGGDEAHLFIPMPAARLSLVRNDNVRWK